ncbi:hypothetical protein [Sphingomonas sp. PAMC 26621]|uniref:hypothetical protein n=1 Tax=Sphingomonas sp. PAMC 26621 TaxID=1112213 RepID=UPI0002896294|nr:hypothetical protein [Sphingomonas sp. PAMC 26621]
MTAPAKAAPMREDITRADRLVKLIFPAAAAAWDREIQASLDKGMSRAGAIDDAYNRTKSFRSEVNWIECCDRVRNALAHTARPDVDIAWRLDRIRDDGGPLTASDKAFLAEAANCLRTARPDAGPCVAAPDHADILETIENAADNWQASGYTSALAEVRDMANVGRSLMEALPTGYCYMDSPAEIVCDLQNKLEEATARPDAGDEDVERMAFPDIGPDPMKGDQRTTEEAVARVREAYVKQQAGVPDQTALVWRWDIGVILSENTRLASRAAARDGVGRGMVERNEQLAAAVAKILPIGNPRLPGDRVVPIYVRMDELRALWALSALDKVQPQ